VARRLSLKVVESDLFWRDFLAVNGEPDSIKEMVAVGLDDDLDIIGSSESEEFAHAALSTRVKVGFGIFEENETAGFCRDDCGNDRQDVADSETDVGGPVVVALTGGALKGELQGDEVNLGVSCSVEPSARADFAEPGFHLINELVGFGLRMENSRITDPLTPVFGQEMSGVFSVPTEVAIEPDFRVGERKGGSRSPAFGTEMLELVVKGRKSTHGTKLILSIALVVELSFLSIESERMAMALWARSWRKCGDCKGNGLIGGSLPEKITPTTKFHTSSVPDQLREWIVEVIGGLAEKKETLDHRGLPHAIEPGKDSEGGKVKTEGVQTLEVGNLKVSDHRQSARSRLSRRSFCMPSKRRRTRLGLPVPCEIALAKSLSAISRA
jgi:hypothetical protein